MALREVIAKFGFDFDKAKLREIDASVTSTKGTLESVVGALAGAAFLAGVRSFIGGIEQAGSALNDMTEQTNISGRNLQIWGYAAELSGGSAEEMNASLRKLSVSLGKAGEGSKEQADALAQLHVQQKNADGSARDINDILPEIVAGFGEIEDPAKKATLAVALFGRSGVKLLGILGQGEGAFNDLISEFDALGGGFTDQAIKAADDYGDNIAKLSLAFTSFKSLVAESVFPVLSKVLVWMSRGIAMFRKFSESTNLVKGTMIALAGASVVALAAMLAPFAPVIAAISTVSLLLDDLLTFMQGGDSVFGAALNSAFGEGTATKVRDSLNHIADEVKAFFEDLIKQPKKFADEVKAIFDDLKSLGQKGTIAQDLSKVTGTDLTDRGIIKSTLGKGAADFLFGEEQAPLPPGQAPQPGPPGAPGEPGSQGPVGATGETQTQMYERIKSSMAEGQGALPKGQDWFADLANFFFADRSPVATTAAMPTTPGTQATTNEIKQENRTTINVSADTPKEITEAVSDGQTKALANERRAALLALEPRAQ